MGLEPTRLHRDSGLIPRKLISPSACSVCCSPNRFDKPTADCTPDSECAILWLSVAPLLQLVLLQRGRSLPLRLLSLRMRRRALPARWTDVWQCNGKTHCSKWSPRKPAIESVSKPLDHPDPTIL